MENTENKNNDQNEKNKKDKKKDEDKQESAETGGAGSIEVSEGVNDDVASATNPFKGKTIARSPLSNEKKAEGKDIKQTHISRIAHQTKNDDSLENVCITEKTDAEPDLQQKTHIARGMGSQIAPGNEDDIWCDEGMDTSSIFQLYENTDVGRESSPKRKKRKRDEKAEDKFKMEESVEMMAVYKALEEVTKKTEKLLHEVKGGSKTKMEIKEASKVLGHAVKVLNKRAKELKQTQEKTATAAREPVATIEAQSVVPVLNVQRTSRTIGLQVDEEEIKRELSKLKEEKSEEITKQLHKKSGWNGLAAIIDYQWPEKCFQNTKMVGAEVLQTASGNVAIVMDPEQGFTGEMAQYIQTSFPDIRMLLDDKIEEGKIEYIKTQVKTVISRGTAGECTRILYIIPYKMNSEGINDTKKLHEILQKLEGETASLGTKEFRLAVAGDHELEYIRKCAEYAFHGTDRKLEIIRSKKGTRDKSKTLPIEKILIRTEGRQYADILRTIKSNVDIDQVGVKIKTIKKTYNGDIMLEVRGGKDKAEALKHEIQKNNNSTRVTIKNEDDIIFITDIDGDVRKDEVRKAVIGRIGSAGEEDVKVLSLKQNQYGVQTAVVSVRKGMAKELLKEGTIGLGWAPCRVRARVNILRCYRCLGFGHHTRNCNGDDNTNVCLKCGKENHRAKECKNAAFCLTCKEEGHRSDQTRCPEYRKLLKEKAKEVDPDNRIRRTGTASTSNRKNDH